MKTNLLQKPLLYPNRMGGKQIGFTGANPLLKNQERFDEVELEKNLNTKESQIAFLQYHLEKAKGSQGFIARGFNKLKSWTGLGLSSKKLDEEIAAFMAGQVPFEKVLEDINKFKYNQKEATEILVDGVGAAISFTAAHAFTNLGNFVSCMWKNEMLTKARALPILGGMMFGSSFKSITKFIDSFGMDKSQRKANRHFFRDMFTGGIAGASGALPGVVGAQKLPMFGSFVGGIALNSGVRYLSLDKEDKSFSDFLHQQIENPGIKLFATAGLATLAACNYKNLNEWEKVKKNCQGSIEDAKPVSHEGLETSFEKLAGEEGVNVFNVEQENSIGWILQKCKDEGYDATQTLETLEKANMFYPKYLQTLPHNFAECAEGHELCTKWGVLPKVIELVKSECTGARKKKEAQDHIDELFGQGKYEIVDKIKDGKTVEAKPLGVGSVAETWVVKAKDDGKEYVVKMVKEGISKEELEKQKEAIIKMLTTKDEKEKDAQVQAIGQLFETWEKELNLKAEAEAATILAKGIKKAKVVKPKETSKDGTAYVMEKAEGELFGNFLSYFNLKSSLGMIEAKTSLKVGLNAILGYANLFLEQIFAVPTFGEKVMHADPHPGNIFINMKDDGKVDFTFIDTGNVLRMSNKEAVKSTIHHLNYFIGNTEAIAELSLKNAKYPAGMDAKKAQAELKKYLDENFYDEKHTLDGIAGIMTIFNTVDNLALKWMQENKVIADPIQANAHKAEFTYVSNLCSLESSFKRPIKKACYIAISESDTIDAEKKKKLLPI